MVYFCNPISGAGAVAQSVEQRTENPCVGGSIPSYTTRTKKGLNTQCVKAFFLITNNYFFFDFAIAVFSSTLNFTILVIRSKGKGLSSGNCTDPFAPL